MNKSSCKTANLCDKTRLNFVINGYYLVVFTFYFPLLTRNTVKVSGKNKGARITNISFKSKVRFGPGNYCHGKSLLNHVFFRESFQSSGCFDCLCVSACFLKAIYNDLEPRTLKVVFSRSCHIQIKE